MRHSAVELQARAEKTFRKGIKKHLYFAEIRMSSSWTVLRPECFATFAAFDAMLSAMPRITSAKAFTAEAETRLAPAFIRILPTGAFGMIDVFRVPIQSPCKKIPL